MHDATADRPRAADYSLYLTDRLSVLTARTRFFRTARAKKVLGVCCSGVGIKSEATIAASAVITRLDYIKYANVATLIFIRV